MTATLSPRAHPWRFRGNAHSYRGGRVTRDRVRRRETRQPSTRGRAPTRRQWQRRTTAPFGDGGWVVDFDADLVMAAIQGNAVEPLTTIGWLMWHIGSKGS